MEQCGKPTTKTSEVMKIKMNVAQAVFLADTCDKLFERAEKAWVRGNNSASTDWGRRNLERCNTLCDRLRNDAEALLKPLGIAVDYPGLYPSFTVKGFAEHSTINAISAALDNSRKAVAA